MGVTPTRGALTPAYNPLLSPSLAMLLRTTSRADEYTPLSAVCSLTLTRSNGCPTMTAHTPPKPPATNDLTCEKVALAVADAAALTSSVDGGEGSFSATACVRASAPVELDGGIVGDDRREKDEWSSSGSRSKARGALDARTWSGEGRRSGR